ncbi:MAG: NADH-quinone oxidoreductase subunit J [Bacteroidota bacterium]
MIIDILFYVFSVITIAPVIYILVTRNVIRAVFSLAFSFLGLSGLYILMSAEFMAVVQLLIYAGGIIVLMVFGLMLTKTTNNEGFITRHRSPVLGSLLVLILIISLSFFAAQSKFAVGELVVFDNQIASIGKFYLTDFIIAFEVVAFLLLVALVGASYLAKKSGE